MTLELWNEYRQQIEHSITNTPRSLQRTIGPSELGTPCLRCLTMKLVSMPKQPETKPAMYTFVGTCVHEHMEKLFSTLDPKRYETEKRVFITELPIPLGNPIEEGPMHIFGSIDVYDTVANATIDWKISSSDRIKSIAHNGIPQEYLVQASLYGIGIAVETGLNNTIDDEIEIENYEVLMPEDYTGTPTLSCIYFLPRNGQSLDSALSVEWEYMPEPGMWALARAKQILNIFNAIHLSYGYKHAKAWANSMPALGAESGECWDCMAGTYLPPELMAAQMGLPEPPAAYTALYDTIQSRYEGEQPDYQTK